MTTLNSQLRQQLNLTSSSPCSVASVSSLAMLDLLKLNLHSGVLSDWSLPCLGMTLCLGEQSREQIVQLFNFIFNINTRQH